MKSYTFASDNTTGLCPEAFAALQAANAGASAPYGSDEFTSQAVEAVGELFKRPCEVFFTSTGTAANALALAHICRSYQSILCHQNAHIQTSECGAPEFFASGSKLLTIAGTQGKLVPENVALAVEQCSGLRHPKPRVLSLTLPTEYGVLYSLEELAALCDVAQRYELGVHLDGARFANAVVALGCEPAEVIEASGADVLCFGGTKAGWSLGEAVVFFNLEMARDFDYRCKQAGQIASKMRFFTAPWAPLLQSGRWLDYARLANQRAQTLACGLQSLGIEPIFPVQANAVFAPFEVQTKLHLRSQGWQFLDSVQNSARLMCSWDTSEAEIEAFLSAVKHA